MSLAGNQQRIFLELAGQLRAHWHRDRNLPARVQQLLAGRRAFGSRDRRLYRELVYTTLRCLPWIEPLLDDKPDEAVRRVAWLAADTPATAAFRAVLATGEPPSGDPAELLPEWFRTHCPEAFVAPQPDTLRSRAPLWLRLQTDQPTAVLAEFAKRGWRIEPSPILPTALRVLDEVDITTTDAYHAGQVEVQDLGSQLLLETVGITSGGRWLDACAGAGGKTLQLARLLGPAGHIDAHDIRPAALRELAARAGRAGLKNIALLSRPATGLYDGVLLDAPCTGTGTWRRAPHLKWTTREADVLAAAKIQLELLVRFARCVRPGGQLVYATCSLSRLENEEVVASFLAQHRDYAAASPARDFSALARGGGLTFLPALHDSDGFFMASLRRTG